MTAITGYCSERVGLPILGIVAIAAICIWRGRKVQHVAWEDDDENPANWYLKDPNKYKVH